MNKTKLRVVMKSLFIKGLSRTQIKAELNATLGKSAFSYTTAERLGRPKSATIEEIVQKIDKSIMIDCQLELTKIVKIAGISKESKHYILTDILGYEKIVNKVGAAFADFGLKITTCNRIGTLGIKV